MAVMPDLMARWIEPTEFVPATNPPSIGSDEPYFPYHGEWMPSMPLRPGMKDGQG